MEKVQKAIEMIPEWEIRQPQFKNLKVNVDSIETIEDLTQVLFTIVGNAITVDINNIPEDKKSILKKYFIEV